MTRSVSYLMRYSRRPGDSPDLVGGLPTHRPYQWPRCQACQDRMAFVGQLYAKDWFPIDGHRALQFYVCEDCRDNAHETVHMEALPRTAPANSPAAGVRCRKQPRLYISYLPVEDSLDQTTFIRRQLTVDDLPDKHLAEEKLGGLFAYDGSESPKITRQNLMIAQFYSWRGIKGAVYLYQSRRHGIYPYLYY